jgi:PGF-pre-PGF domain-containing protein
MSPLNDDDGGSAVSSPSPSGTTGGLSTVLPMTVTVNIAGNTAAGQATVTGVKLSGLVVTGTVQPGPGANATAPPGTVYQYISLVPAGYTSISRARINFTVPQSWLAENGIAPANIVLYHSSAGGWETLPTTALYSRDGMSFFSAESPGLSLFAAAGRPAAAIPAAPVKPPAVTSSPVQDTPPVPVATTPVPVVTQTTAPPAAAAQPSAPSPLGTIILIIAAIGVLGGGSFLVRRWWIRRQNPGLFTEYE